MEISLNMVDAPKTVVDDPKADQPALKVTAEAGKEAKRLLGLQGTPDMVVRIAVQGGGCSGFTYQMTFDSKVSEFDEVIQTDDAKFVVDPKSALFLRGTTLDYVNALMGGGFKFVNPNATSTCGCGESFSA